jgi:RimJ/RimL family protein N-acetyltransferase
VSVPSDLTSVRLRPVHPDERLPDSSSEWDQWGEKDPEAMALRMRRWAVVIDRADGETVVGDMTAHVVWYGATRGSAAYNIGISLVPEHRGRGLGSVAQRALADLLHAEGVVRVEASTDVNNLAERRSLEKAGFAFEGIARSAQARADGQHDLAVYSSIINS